MLKFDANAPGTLYQLNYSNRPMNHETGTRRGSSGGIVNQSYFVIEQIVDHDYSIVLPQPISGFKVRSINLHNNRVAAAVRPTQYSVVGVLKEDVRVMDLQNDLGGFVQTLLPFSDGKELMDDIARLAYNKPENALDIIEKLYRDLRVKSELALPQ